MSIAEHQRMNGLVSLAAGWLVRGLAGWASAIKDRDRICGRRVVGVEEEDAILIALEAGNVVVEGHKGAVKAGDLEGASGVDGPRSGARAYPFD